MCNKNEKYQVCKRLSGVFPSIVSSSSAISAVPGLTPDILVWVWVTVVVMHFGVYGVLWLVLGQGGKGETSVAP